MIARLLTIVFVLAGGGTASQAPEFTQQYRQALGGAVGELRVIVEDFDRASADSGLTRDEALGQYAQVESGFLAERGQQMTATIDRFERLAEQEAAIEGAGPFERILLVMQEPDARLMETAWERFEPAIPLTIAGGVMAALGAFIGWMLAFGGVQAGKASGRMLKGRNKGRAAKGA